MYIATDSNHKYVHMVDLKIKLTFRFRSMIVLQYNYACTLLKVRMWSMKNTHASKVQYNIGLHLCASARYATSDGSLECISSAC